jgi:hypothetical protein
MEQHVKVLGVLYIVLGALGILAAVGCLVLFGGLAGITKVASESDPDALIGVTVLAILGIGLFIFIAVLSIPGIFAGLGLLKFRSWARILTIILSALNLLNFPFGTALGVYGLWVLLSRETEALFASPPPSSLAR